MDGLWQTAHGSMYWSFRLYGAGVSLMGAPASFGSFIKLPAFL